MTTPSGQFPTAHQPAGRGNVPHSPWLNPALLRDPTLCPACAGPVLASDRTSCSMCGLPLTGHAGLALWKQSQSLADSLDARGTVVARLRAEFPAPQRGDGQSGTSAPAPESAGWCNTGVLSDPARCPACGVLLHSGNQETNQCSTCGLFVGGPLGLELWNRSQDVALELRVHADLISQVRARATADPVNALMGPEAPVPPTAGSAPVPAVPPLNSTHPAGGPPPAPVKRTGFFSIQNVLLILGAALLGGAGIVFLVFSWGRIDIAVRAVVIGALTVALFAGAWFAARRELRASAEAIGGLAALLLCLDAWALHATGVITGIRLSDYLAMMSVVTGLVLIGAGYALRLRTPRLIGTFLIPLGTLAWASGQSSAFTATAILSLGALAGLLAFVPGVDRLTRWILGASAAFLIPAAALTSFLTLVLEGQGFGSLSFLLVSVVVGAYALLHAGTLANALASIFGVLLTSTGLLGGLWMAGEFFPFADVERIGVFTAPLTGALAGALATAIVALALAREGSDRFGLNRSGGFAAAVTFCAVSLPPVLWFGIHLLLGIGSGAPSQLPGLGHFIPLGVLLLGSIALRIIPGAHRFTHGFLTQVTLWSGTLIVVGLPMLLADGTYVLRTVDRTWVVLASLVLAVLGAAAAGLVREPGPWQMALRNIASGSAGLALLGGLAQFGEAQRLDPAVLTGQVLFGTSLTGLGLVLFLVRSWSAMRPVPFEPMRMRVPSRRARAILLGLAVGLISSGIAFLADDVVRAHRAGLFIVALATLVLSLILLIRSLLAGTQASPDLRAILIGSAPVWLLTCLMINFPAGTTLVQWVALLGIGVALMALTLFLVHVAFGLSAARESDRLRQVTAGLLPFAALTVVRSVAAFDLPVHWPLVVLIVLSTLPFLAGHRLAGLPHRRRVLEIASAVVIFATLLPLLNDITLLGIGFLIVAAGALALSTTPGRSVFVWIGTGLTIVGAWTLSIANDVTSPEAYSAPVALLVCVLGVQQLRRGRSRTVLLMGVILFVLPTAILASDNSVWRTIAIAVLALPLTFATAVLSKARMSGWDVTQQTLLGRNLGFLTIGIVLLAPWRRAFSLEMGDVVALAWTAVATALAVWALHALDVPERRGALSEPRVWGPGVLAVVLTFPVLNLIARSTVTGPLKALVMVSVLVLWGLIALLGSPKGWPGVRSMADVALRTIPPLAIGLLIAVGASGWTPLPGDVLLTVAGLGVAGVTIRTMLSSTTGSSWATVGFGVLATVVPSSVTMLTDPTGWRVSLAVLTAFVWLLLGLRQRWQAPVTLGVLALLGQVLVLAGPPALAAVSGLPGWIVLAFVGAVLLAAGLMYERQVARAKTAVRRFSDLR